METRTPPLLNKPKSLPISKPASQLRPRRRYPRLLSTNKNGTITANPLILPTHLPAPAPLIVPPLKPSASSKQTSLPLRILSPATFSRLRTLRTRARIALETATSAARTLDNAVIAAAAKPLWHEFSILLTRKKHCECHPVLSQEAPSENTDLCSVGAEDVRKKSGIKGGVGCSRERSLAESDKARHHLRNLVAETTARKSVADDLPRGTAVLGNAAEDKLRSLKILQRTKDYEMCKLVAFAEAKRPLIIEENERRLIQAWLEPAKGVVAHAILFIVLGLNMDTGLVSVNREEVWGSLRELETDHLRILEGLMLRTGTEEGLQNWGILTAKFGNTN